MSVARVATAKMNLFMLVYHHTYAPTLILYDTCPSIYGH